ncbi:MAG: hypothetical protein N0E54_01120, partial [Candidatus Thiodiazotropha taylori]|nr:hypothetical protein [Candidatus Thiodiazotropha endolucinida]MCW4227319.1 hypothetical protein [Candidatus Thiodiazotropha taylori]
SEYSHQGLLNHEGDKDHESLRFAQQPQNRNQANYPYQIHHSSDFGVCRIDMEQPPPSGYNDGQTP